MDVIFIKLINFLFLLFQLFLMFCRELKNNRLINFNFDQILTTFAYIFNESFLKKSLLNCMLYKNLKILKISRFLKSFI